MKLELEGHVSDPEVAWKRLGDTDLLNRLAGNAAMSMTVGHGAKGPYIRGQMSGPLGVAPTLLSSDGRLLTIDRGGEPQVLDLEDPAAVRAATGWHFPVTALPHWLKGTPAPDLPLTDLTLDTGTGVATGFTQGDWQVAIESHGQFGVHTLPLKLVIRGEDARATVIVRDWRTEPAE